MCTADLLPDCGQQLLSVDGRFGRRFERVECLRHTVQEPGVEETEPHSLVGRGQQSGEGNGLFLPGRPMLPGSVQCVQIRDIHKGPQLGPPEPAEQTERQLLGISAVPDPQRSVAVLPHHGVSGDEWRQRDQAARHLGCLIRYSRRQPFPGPGEARAPRVGLGLPEPGSDGRTEAVAVRVEIVEQEAGRPVATHVAHREPAGGVLRRVPYDPLFGGVSILQLYVQGMGGIGVPAQVMSMLPYIATILVLTIISAGSVRGKLDAPACLGKPFRPAT